MYLDQISNLAALMDWPVLTSAENQQGYCNAIVNPGRASNPSRPILQRKEFATIGERKLTESYCVRTVFPRPKEAMPRLKHRLIRCN